MAAFSPVMAMAPVEGSHAQTQRPNMRRKSSAQNLLTSFGTKQSSAAASLNHHAQASQVASPSAFATALPTPTTATSSMAKEWETQSLHSDTTHASSVPNGGNGSSAVQGTSVEMLRELVKKRIITLTYLRNVHEGCVR